MFPPESMLHGCDLVYTLKPGKYDVGILGAVLVV